MGTVVQLKNQINNSYLELKNSVEDKLILVDEKINKDGIKRKRYLYTRNEKFIC